MANFIEKKLPKPVRGQLKTLIGTGLGIFIGLRYNDYIKKVIEMILPSTDGLLMEGLILVGLTFGVVWFMSLLEKGLDGK